MKKGTLLLLLTLFTGFMFGQAPLRPADLVEYHKQKGLRSQPVANLFSVESASVRARPEINQEVTEGVLLNFNQQSARQLIAQAPEFITMSLPFDGVRNVDVELVKVNIYAPGFSVTNSANEKINWEMGTHYRGVIKDMDGSIASVSMFQGEIVGMFSGPRIGNYTLGALQQNNAARTHILYNDANLVASNDFDCATPDDDGLYTTEQLNGTPNTRALTDCIRVFYEVDYDIYQDKGATTTAFITSEFNEIATLYANENLTYSLSEVNVITNSSNAYSNQSSAGMRSQFQSRYNGFNGDLAHMVSYKSSGGIAAGFSGLCNSDPDQSMCFSNIRGNFSTVPTYSWDIMVQTHEMGHLNGSRHTHACVWNGNNTAIDGCSGGTEGSCALPGFPSGGGTLMSYCHLQSVGINFSNGFGSQPGNVIRSATTNASCLGACDGGGGGDECTDTEVTVQINLDNYPAETSWQITNSGGAVVASGSGYSGAGTTVNEKACLTDGCYTFTINDSYGDGICCGYGNGSYSVFEGSNSYASGGQFTSTESTNFCIGGGGGNPCPSINFNDYTVTSYGGGQDADGTNSVQDGGATLYLEDNTWKDIAYSYTVTSNTVIEFDFRSTTQGEIHGIGFDTDESISSNRTFKVHGTQNWGITNYDNYSGSAWTTYTIPVGTIYTGSFSKLFFVNDKDGTANNNNSYFRNIKVYEGSCGSLPGTGLTATPAPQRAILGTQGEFKLDIYPSPLSNVMYTRLDAPEGDYQATLLDVSGRTIWKGVIPTYEKGHNIAQLPAGIYVMKVQVGDAETLVQKVVKTN